MADQSIINEITQAIDNIDFGSVEVIVQEGQVTQISTRIIKKTSIKTKAEKKVTGTVVRREGKPGININFKY